MLSLILMNNFFPDKLMLTASLALTTISLVSPYWRGRLRDEWSFDTPPSTDPTHVNFFIDNRSRVKRWAEFAVGMLAGSILFQKFFRLASFYEVAAFLYLAVAWLANIVLASASHDLGVFNFLLGNVIVGCSVSEYGLRGPTWNIAYGAAILLYGLRVKLESVVLVNRGGKGTQVVIW